MEPSTQSALDFPPPLPDRLLQIICDARYSGKLSDCESDILFLLTDLRSGPRAGRSRALSISEMQGIWTRGDQHLWSDRQIKGAVKELIHAHRIPICSSRDSRSGGYFLGIDSGELAAAERLIHAEIVARAKILKVFNPKNNFARYLAGQLPIESESQQ